MEIDRKLFQNTAFEGAWVGTRPEFTG